MPTYSGGLGVLAGDTIRAAADLKVPMVAVTLLHRKGYFYQRLDANGWQSEEPVEWVAEDFLTEMPQRITVTIAECHRRNHQWCSCRDLGLRTFRELYDRYIAGWNQDYFSLHYALSIPKEEIWQAHAVAKKTLISYANREDNSGFDDEVLTIGVARRASLYKRTDLLFTDLERLRSIARNAGPFQVIFAGKAHPQDREGKKLIQRIFAFGKALRNDIRIGYLPRYDMELAKLLTAEQTSGSTRRTADGGLRYQRDESCAQRRAKPECSRRVGGLRDISKALPDGPLASLGPWSGSHPTAE